MDRIQADRVHRDAPVQKMGTVIKDPVCGMGVDPHSAFAEQKHGGQSYFCSSLCLEKFRAAPQEYVAANKGEEIRQTKADSEGEYACPMHPEVQQAGSGTCPKCGMALEPVSPVAPAAKTEYVCPMHPEIVRPQPGSCPICGMALEPKTVSEEREENPELKSMTRRFRVSVALTTIVLASVMGKLIPGNRIEHWASERFWTWFELLLSTPVVLWGGWPFFVRGWRSIVNRSLNMFTLIGLGVGIAYSYSLVAALFPGIFPYTIRDEAGQVAVYFEAAAVITTLVLLGQVLELRARSQTGAAIKALWGLAPKTARLVKEDGSELDVSLDQVKPGDKLRDRPGEKIPADGRQPGTRERATAGRR